MIVQFGEWTPDQPRYGNTCITATNVRPTENGYGPFKGPSAFGDALPAGCVGVYSFRRVSGAREKFAGTETNLYRLNGTAWDDVTQASGDYSNSDFWRFTIYGDRVVATNGVDNPQKFDLASDSVFSDLTNAPKHRYPIVVKDVLVALDLQDGSGNELAFSAVNDSETWTALSGGGGQSFADGGPLLGGTGGEFGTILQELGVTIMTFVGGDFRFTFEPVEGAIGCIDASSIVKHKGNTYYLSSEGFQVFNGAQSVNISSGRTTETFFSSARVRRVLDNDDVRVTDGGDARVINPGNVVVGALDPENSSVLWTYPSDTVNKIIGYNYRLDRWYESDSDVTCLHVSYHPEGNVLAGFNSSNNLVLFNGADLTPILSTGDLQISNRNRETTITAAYGIIDSAHNISIARKLSKLSDTEDITTGSSSAKGKCSIRSHGKFHRIQLDPTATFTEIVGVELETRRHGARV